MKLYYSKGACSLAVRIIIHEASVKCSFEAVNLKTKQTETGADFLAINPKGAVPTLVTAEGEVLSENAVIQQYLADQYQATQLLPPLGNFKRYRVLEWLNFVSTDLHKGCAPLFNSNLNDDVKDTVFKPILKSKIDLVDKHLQQHTYLLGDTFTLPDAYLFVILSWLPHFKMQLDAWKNISPYFAELKKRPAVQKALQEEGLV